MEKQFNEQAISRFMQELNSTPKLETTDRINVFVQFIEQASAIKMSTKTTNAVQMLSSISLKDLASSPQKETTVLYFLMHKAEAGLTVEFIKIVEQVMAEQRGTVNARMDEILLTTFLLSDFLKLELFPQKIIHALEKVGASRRRLSNPHIRTAVATIVGRGPGVTLDKPLASTIIDGQDSIYYYMISKGIYKLTMLHAWLSSKILLGNLVKTFKQDTYIGVYLGGKVTPVELNSVLGDNFVETNRKLTITGKSKYSLVTALEEYEKLLIQVNNSLYIPKNTTKKVEFCSMNRYTDCYNPPVATTPVEEAKKEEEKTPAKKTRITTKTRK